MTNPNDPAFSDREIFVAWDTANKTINRMVGLTKREYFAAMAMQGLLSTQARSDEASVAVRMADLLIKELSK